MIYIKTFDSSSEYNDYVYDEGVRKVGCPFIGAIRNGDVINYPCLDSGGDDPKIVA